MANSEDHIERTINCVSNNYELGLMWLFKEVGPGAVLLALTPLAVIGMYFAEKEVQIAIGVAMAVIHAGASVLAALDYRVNDRARKHGERIYQRTKLRIKGEEE